MIENLAKIVINDYGGDIVPLFINNDEISGTGLCNPSIFVDDKIRLILRHVEYSLWHSEGGNYQSSEQGFLSYYHREDKNELKTNNYYCELDPETFKINRFNLIDTSKLDVKPIWNFIGLEDARLVKWTDKYYMSGVRRDTTTNGVGRMELSEIEIDDYSVEEVSRTRIDVPDNNSYCEKNWMPFLNKPYHYVKWTNPTEIVKINLEDKVSETIYSGEKIKSLKRDIRGSSQLIEWIDNSYLCITHETDFVLEDIHGYKDVDYYHRFIIFNEDFSIKYISDYFNFMCARVEFCIGLAEYNDDILITFGFQDNGSYLLKINKENLRKLLDTELNNQEKNYHKLNYENSRNSKNKLDNLLLNYINNPYCEYNCFYLARENELEKQYALAMSYYLKCADNTQFNKLAYESLIRINYCLDNMGGRDGKCVSALEHAISILPNRPEAYYILSLHYSWRNNFKKAYLYSQLTLYNDTINNELHFENQYKGELYSLFQKAYTGSNIGKIIESYEIYKGLLELDIDDNMRNIINDNMDYLKGIPFFSKINEKKIVVNSEKIDIVLQGKYNDNVLRIAYYYLELDFVNNIIISCWEDDIINNINNNKIIIIKNKIPFNSGTGRRNLQIVSSLEGIKKTTTSYVVKIRNDQRYTHESMIKMYKFYEKYKERKLRFYYDERRPLNRICVCGNFSDFSFHPRDHLFWGNREDLIDLFSLPLEKENIINIKIIDPKDLYLYYEYFIRTETYIGAHYLTNFDQKINYYLLDPKKYLYDNSEKYSETRELSDKLTPQVFKSFPREGIDLEWYKNKWITYPYENQRNIFGERWHEDGL